MDNTIKHKNKKHQNNRTNDNGLASRVDSVEKQISELDAQFNCVIDQCENKLTEMQDKAAELTEAAARASMLRLEALVAEESASVQEFVMDSAPVPWYKDKRSYLLGGVVVLTSVIASAVTSKIINKLPF